MALSGPSVNIVPTPSFRTGRGQNEVAIHEFAGELTFRVEEFYYPSVWERGLHVSG